MSKVCIVIAPEFFQDHEYQTPRQILEQADHQITVASKQIGTAIGAFGLPAQVDKTLSQIFAKDYDALIFVGGGGALAYQQDPEAHRLAQEFFTLNKLTCAICIAPTILAYAGVLKNKNATVWNDEHYSQAELLRQLGANFIDQAVVKDDNLITADGPQSAEEFGQVILNSL